MRLKNSVQIRNKDIQFENIFVVVSMIVGIAAILQQPPGTSPT